MTENIEPAAQAEAPDEAKTYTKEQVEQIVKQRLANVKATPPADYDELKAKAEKWDAKEEADKTELQRATERAEAAEKQLADLAEAARREKSVRDAAERYGVDADVLSLMSGDVEANAEMLQRKEAEHRRYPSVPDMGQQPPVQVTRESIEAIKDPVERVRARAANMQIYE